MIQSKDFDADFKTALVVSRREAGSTHRVAHLVQHRPSFYVIVAGSSVYGLQLNQIIVTEDARREIYQGGVRAEVSERWFNEHLPTRLAPGGNLIYL